MFVVFVLRKYLTNSYFSNRLLGAFRRDRLLLMVYSIFNCVIRINTMLSVNNSLRFLIVFVSILFHKISSLVLNLYNYTDNNVPNVVLLVVGILLTLLWLITGIGMVRY